MPFNLRLIVIVIFCFFSLGLDNSKSYRPDLSLKQNWTEEKEKSLHLAPKPYALEYVTADKRLIVGLLTNNPDHQEFQKKMILAIKQQKPNVILDQSEIKPSDKELLSYLEKYGYTAEDLGYFQVIETLNQFYAPRMHTSQDLLKNTEYLIDLANRSAGLTDKGQRFSVDKFQHWFSSKTGMTFTLENIKKGDLQAPTGTQSTEYLQALSSRADEIQDEYFLERLAEALNKKENKTIVIFRGASKFITEGPVWTKMMGVSPRIFN